MNNIKEKMLAELASLDHTREVIARINNKRLPIISKHQALANVFLAYKNEELDTVHTCPHCSPKYWTYGCVSVEGIILTKEDADSLSEETFSWDYVQNYLTAKGATYETSHT